MHALRCLVIAVVGVGCGDNKALSVDAGLIQCSNGVDDDGDGTIDFPDDLGCDNSADETEDSLAKPRCSDNRDNDGDGKVDYPNDPGCTAMVEDEEVDDCPAGPGCPQCADGVDNDVNGLTDYPADPGCAAAGDLLEFIADPDACGVGLVIKQPPVGMNITGMLDSTSICNLMTTCGGGGGSPGFAYVIHVLSPKILVASTDHPGTLADTVIDLRSSACEDASAHIACSDDIVIGTNTNSRLIAALTPGTYYVIVEGHDATASGPFELSIETFAGEGAACTMTSECGPSLVCRVPIGTSNMVCAKPVCSDGLDDDADSETDYPNDPGCTDPTDSTEADDCPSGPMCPDCADGIDNDGDTQIDFPNDPSCSAASGSIESCQGEQDPIFAITSGTTVGTIVGSHNNHNPSCGSEGGLDNLYTLTVPAMRTITIDTIGTSFDSLLSLMSSACTEPSIACNDDGAGAPHDVITRTNLAAGTYVVAVDGYNGLQMLLFTVHVAGTMAPGSRCDPELTLNGALVCPVANPCEGALGAMRCRATLCIDGVDNDGDGEIDFPNDPGCTSVDDDTETDDCPSGPTCPDCSDGTDNDGDTFTDYPSDPSCLSASGSSESCVQSEPIVVVTTAATIGTTAGATNDFTPPPGLFNGHVCSSSVTHTAPDVALQLDLPGTTSLNLSLNPVSYDSAHVLLGATCMGTPIECFDSQNMALTNLAGGTYFLVVDGYSTGSGAFTLNVSGAIASGQSCESPLATSGALVCGPGTICAGSVGSRTCRPAQCSDGLDNNAAGGIDYPNDPGCTSPDDNSEDDVSCPGASCPICANGMDDDADTFTDFPSDLQCGAASFPIENYCPIEPNIAGVIELPFTSGTMAAPAVDNYDQSCQANTTNDVGYLLRLPVGVTLLTIDTEQSIVTDTVLSLRDAQCGAQIACDDDAGVIGTGLRSVINAPNVAAGDYAILVDSYGATANNGPFTLHVRGVVAAGTTCTSPLFASGVLVCPTGQSCTGGMCQ